MAELTAVPTQLLTDIADKIREKRDITTPIKVEDMPMQIGLIGVSNVETIFKYYEVEASISDNSMQLDTGDMTINDDSTFVFFAVNSNYKSLFDNVDKKAWMVAKHPFLATIKDMTKINKTTTLHRVIGLNASDYYSIETSISIENGIISCSNNRNIEYADGMYRIFILQLNL